MAATASTDLAPSLNSAERSRLRSCEHTIQEHLGKFVEVGLALAEISAARLYRETHRTFENYLREKWDLETRRAEQLIAAAHVAENVTGSLPASEPMRTKWFA
jgi:hypothetical protein